MEKDRTQRGPLLMIGAGPAGLTAAYELSKNGVPSLVLEQDNTVGGIARTVEHHGYRFDLGGHRFFSKMSVVNQIWREILPEDFLTRPRLSRIYYDGHFFNYPIQPANALAGLGAKAAVGVLASYALAKLNPVARHRISVGSSRSLLIARSITSTETPESSESAATASSNCLVSANAATSRSPRRPAW